MLVRTAELAVEFVELELGFTFVSVARNASSKEKHRRNCEHIRKVCQKVRHFMCLLPLDRRVEFCEMLGMLEDQLRSLHNQYRP